MLLELIKDDIGAQWDGDALVVKTDTADLVVTEFDDGVMIDGRSDYDCLLPVRYRFADMDTAWTLLVPAVLYLLDGEVRV